jgi:inorganic triphosphatase YgiF
LVVELAQAQQAQLAVAILILAHLLLVFFQLPQDKDALAVMEQLELLLEVVVAVLEVMVAMALLHQVMVA